MASGAENNQLPRNQEQHSGQSDQPPPAVSNHPPSGGNNYPPSATMYPQQPYPAGVPPQGYPGGYGYSPYPPAAYAQDPAVAYYATQQYSHADEGGNACVRCVCLIMVMSLMLTVIASIVFFFVAKSDHVTAKVENLSVSNFSTNKVVTGKWEVKLSLETSRSRLRIDPNTVDPSLYQKDTWLAGRSTPSAPSSPYWDDYSWWGGSNVEKIDFKFEVNNATAPAAEMEKEIKEAGGVTFTVIVNVNYSEKSSGFWSDFKHGTMKVTCKDLKIGLAVGANSGTLTGGKKDCEISK